MGVSVFPAPAAGSKTRYVVTLTSGTSWTVPAGVTYVNATLVGGGGGGSNYSGSGYNAVDATSGQVITTNVSTTPGASISYAIGAGGSVSNGSDGGNGGDTTFTGATTATGGGGGKYYSSGTTGRAGRTGFTSGNFGQQGSAGGGNGGTGGSGSIELEYWVQEIIMTKLFAVIENNTVVNVIVGVEDEVVAANPGKYVEYTNGWDYNNGIDGGTFFPQPVTE